MMTVLAGMSAAILALAPITNPIGGLAAFAGLTAGDSPAAVRSQAWKTGIYVFAILAVFAVSGSLIMRFFGFDLPSLQIAGGLVVAHSGFSMLENKRRSTHEEAQHATAKPDVSFSPMALPLIAGPGSIGVVIALAARNTAVGFHIGIVLGIAVTAALIAAAAALRHSLDRQAGRHRRRRDRTHHGLPDPRHRRRAHHPRGTRTPALLSENPPRPHCAPYPNVARNSPLIHSANCLVSLLFQG